MKDLPTAVISAAGRGTRMGHGRPKCLTPILGRPLIEWQMQALASFPQVVVAIGFKGEDVIAAVRQVRNDAVFVTNPEFETTGTAASLSLAMAEARRPVISVDGDLLARPGDLLRLARSSMPSIGVCAIQSVAPVAVSIDVDAAGTKWAKSFHHQEPAPPGALALEWTGLVTIDPGPRHISGKAHVYQMITPLLPCPAIQVECREIDYPSEIPLMEAWLQEQIRQGHFHG